MSALLVITTGQTDVQILVDGERRELEKNRCSALHAQLARRSDWWLGDSRRVKSARKIIELPEQAFELCTPKLDAVLEYASTNDISISAALLLETSREPQEEGGDPGHAGAVLARRLQEKLAVKPRIATYLSGVERLEDRSEPRDAVVRREVVARIDGACRQAIEDAKPTAILIAANSGLPTVASLVDQIARLRAGEIPVVTLHVPDASRTGGDGLDRAVAPAPSPHASYEARRHALELIRGGHLLAGWGAVRHLHCDPVERRWTSRVEWLYLWASSLPLPRECDLELLKHPRTAVQAALRVELALRAEDVPAAVHGTVAFFEAALWDHLESHLQPHPDRCRLYSVDPPPPANLIRTGSPKDDLKQPFETDTGTSEKGSETWYRVHDDDVCAVRLAKHYLNKPDLLRLGQAVSKVRLLRNDVAHDVPTPERMAEARQRMQDAQLWSDGGRFLCQDLVTRALAELGVEEPTRLADQLQQAVAAELLDVRLT
jgi:hypothetical protein